MITRISLVDHTARLLCFHLTLVPQLAHETSLRIRRNFVILATSSCQDIAGSFLLCSVLTQKQTRWLRFHLESVTNKQAPSYFTICDYHVDGSACSHVLANERFWRGETGWSDHCNRSTTSMSVVTNSLKQKPLRISGFLQQLQQAVEWPCTTSPWSSCLEKERPTTTLASLSL